MSLSELYVGCRTYRLFTQDAIPDALIHSILENARIASCGMNAQNLRFVCIKSSEAVAKMQPLVRWAGSLPREIANPKPGETPTAFVVIVTRKGAAKNIISYDVGIACNVIATTAWEGGVGSCILYSVKRPDIAAIVGLEDGEEIPIVVALGYPAHKSTIVPVPESGSLTYYVDEDRNYYVPKRAFKDVAKII